MAARDGGKTSPFLVANPSRSPNLAGEPAASGPPGLGQAAEVRKAAHFASVLGKGVGGGSDWPFAGIPRNFPREANPGN